MAQPKNLILESTVNPWVVSAQYAVRGEILLKANALNEKLKSGEKLPFEKMVYCNIGNPQALLQKPMSFNREVISLVTNPPLLAKALADDGSLRAAFAPDALERASTYLKRIPEGVGAYSTSQGYIMVREEVAEFISKRDGYPASPQNIFLSDGASGSVKLIMNILIRSGLGTDGILVPIPQYPLYSALAALANGTLVGYYLDEESGWGMRAGELERAIENAEKDGVSVRALVVINPGNPTGQCFSSETMQELIMFCTRRGLMLLADEVYQENVYGANPFISFKKMVMDMAHGKVGALRAEDRAAVGAMQLVSFHSVSKGFLGECGVRGGYMEIMNIDEGVRAQILKLASISLCPNTVGQISVGLMVNPPAPGSPSHTSWKAERDAIMDSLRRRASVLHTFLNSLESVTCAPLDGALYAFPKVVLPPAAIAAAEAAGKTPDTFYCLALLEATGIVVVPGTGFKQVPGTFHFRTTFLPPEEDMATVQRLLAGFHRDFMAKYKDAKTEL